MVEVRSRLILETGCGIFLSYVSHASHLTALCSHQVQPNPPLSVVRKVLLFESLICDQYKNIRPLYLSET